MDYPTLEEAERADHRQLCIWYRFLPSPGINGINRGMDTNSKEFKEQSLLETKIINTIVDRWRSFGGFTPEISKSIDH